MIAAMLRTLGLAALAAGAALAIMVLLHPFGGVLGPVGSAADAAGADALRQQIADLRTHLQQTETALDQARAAPVAPLPGPDAALRAQLEAQVAAATERRDLATRHARAIRDALARGLAVSSMPEIRDSVVIGQLLTQQVALEAKIADAASRLKFGHPTMRALEAQRAALATQIAAEAASIASALEAEARLDDAQIKLLQSQMPAAPDGANAGADIAALEAAALSQRAQLNALVDAYFNLTRSASAPSPAEWASLPNLAIAGAAGLLTMLLAAFGASGRRRPAVNPADLSGWQADHDPETAAEPVAPAARRPMRLAS